MWTRRASKPKVQGAKQQHELVPEIRAKVEAASAPPPPALDDSQYGVRSFEFGGEPRPVASRPISIALEQSSMHERESDSDSESANTELEHEHETPMPAVRKLQAESPPRYSPHLAPINLEMPSESGITARVDIGTVDERIGEALAGAMRDTYRTREVGEIEEDNTSDLTVHPAAPIPTAAISVQGQTQPLQHSRPATPVHVHALSSPIFAAHSPNPSFASGASASGMDTDLDLEHDHYDFDSDLSSAPPSPTSLTSLPSYVSSLSSASRSSSPLGLGYSSGTGSGVGGTAEGAIAAAVARARQRGRGGEEQGQGQGQGQAAELVIPELSLPSSSLHLSLRDWEGPVKGVKVVLLGPAELTKRVIRAIGEREECVNVRHEGRGKGVVGVVRDGEMLGVVETGVTAEQARIRLLRTYTTLHGLLNPASQDEAQLGEVVRAYSAREDWIHAVVGVHTASRHQAESLSHLVPVLDTGTSTTSTPDSPLGGPTPMPRTAPSSSYFDNPITRSLGDVGAIADSIIFALSPSPTTSSPSTRSRSVSTFLAWRPLAMSSSNSSLDSRGHAPTSATSTSTSGMDMDADPAHLMPTVARARGGGEWEATLSRRLAQRRGSQAQVGLSSTGASGAEGAGSGGGGGGTRDRDGTTRHRPGSRRSSNDAKRRRSLGKGKHHSVEPLFPPRPASPARDAKAKLHPKQELSKGRLSRRPGCMPDTGLGLGVGKLVSSTFKYMGTWTKGWRGAVLAAVVVGVVGLRLYFWQ